MSSSSRSSNERVVTRQVRAQRDQGRAGVDRGPLVVQPGGERGAGAVDAHVADRARRPSPPRSPATVTATGRISQRAAPPHRSPVPIGISVPFSPVNRPQGRHDPPVRPDRRRRGAGWPAGDRRPSLRRRPRRRARRRLGRRSGTGRCCSTAGRSADGDTLRGAGVVNGSRIDAVAPPDERPVTSAASRPPAEAAAVVTVIAEAGPAAGAVVHLPPGRHVVGRSPSAAVALADGALEPHHALLEVDDDGTVRFIQLSGRVTGRIGAEPVTSPAAVPDGGVLLLGASRLRVGRELGPAAGSAVLTATPGDPWRRTLRRTPRPRLRWEPAPIPVPAAAGPAAPPSAVGLLTAATTLLGSAAIAVVMRSPMFLLFGAVGVVASARHVDRRPDRRRPRRPPEPALAALATSPPSSPPSRSSGQLARRTTSPSTPRVAAAVSAGSTLRGDVWSRRIDHDDAFRVTLGWGPVDWDVVVDAGGRAAPAGVGRRRRRRRAIRRRPRAGRPRSGCGAGGRWKGRPCRGSFADRPAGHLGRSRRLAALGRRR